MNRCGGVLMHISSLPGEFGIGTLGREAYEFVDFLSQSGFGAWQVLPIGPCDDYNSPYSGSSAYAGNVFFIDPETLYEKGLLTEEEKNSCRCENIHTAQYEFLRKTRIEVFRLCVPRISNEERENVCSFIRENKWVEDYALFCALKEKNNGKSWTDWEKPLKMRDKKAISDAICELSDDLFFYSFLQYEFFSQWEKLKKYANEHNIGIIGDMPIYLAHDSADVWANSDMFMLDEDMNLTHCAGVPPDYFCIDGQKWGNPLYNWEKLKKNGFELWLSRIDNALKMFDAVRIDHFRAFSSYWAIPYGEDAKNGQWEKGPRMELFNLVKERHKNAQIIAEDLGDIDDDVRNLVKECGFPGMGVMQFAFISPDDSPHLPHNYTKNTVGYTGTHDNETLLGWLWSASEESRNYALDYCGFSGDWGRGGSDSGVIRSIIQTLWRSGAILSVVPIQDLCGFGGDTCMNHPGKADGNWEFRLTKEALSGIDTQFYSKLNSLYKRGAFF